MPAAAMATRISPGPGFGTGRVSGCKASGPPGVGIPITVIVSGTGFMGSDPSGMLQRSVTAAVSRLAFGAHFSRCEVAMSLFPDDDRPKPKSVHEIGQDLSMLSLN